MLCAQAECGREACPAQLQCVLAQCGTCDILHCTGNPLVCPYPSLSIPCCPDPKGTITLCVSQAVFNLLAQSQSRGSEVRGLRESGMSRAHPRRPREVPARDADLEGPNRVMACARSCRRGLCWPWEWAGMQQVPWQQQEAQENHL